MFSWFMQGLKDEDEEFHDVLLPWDDVTLAWRGREDELANFIRGVSRDKNTFLCDAPQDNEPDPEIELDQPFVYHKANDDTIRAILKLDTMLATQHSQLVPKFVNEERFWRNYFYRVHVIKHTRNIATLRATIKEVNTATQDRERQRTAKHRISDEIAQVQQAMPKIRELLVILTAHMEQQLAKQQQQQQQLQQQQQQQQEEEKSTQAVSESDATTQDGAENTSVPSESLEASKTEVPSNNGTEAVSDAPAEANGETGEPDAATEAAQANEINVKALEDELSVLVKQVIERKKLISLLATEIDDEAFIEHSLSSENNFKLAMRQYSAYEKFKADRMEAEQRAAIAKKLKEQEEARQREIEKLNNYVPELVGSSRQPPSALTDEMRRQLHRLLPFRNQGCNWTLVYSNLEHGTSLGTLYRNVDNYGDKPTVMVIQTKQRVVFGCYAADKWEVQQGYFGRGESFVFTFADGDFKSYPWSHRDEYFQLCRERSISVGGDKPAIYFDSDFEWGSSGACSTFASPSLNGTRGTDFEIFSVEIWGFLPGVARKYSIPPQVQMFNIATEAQRQSEASTTAENALIGRQAQQQQQQQQQQAGLV